MNYSQKKLDDLWLLIKDKINNFAGEYTGLKKVSFDEPLDSFVEKYGHVISQSSGDYFIHTRVVTDIDVALDILSSVDIIFHHLSCAAKTSFEDNSALCIHYKKKDKQQFGAIAIPGVNYVPTKETLSRLKSIKKLYLD